MDLINKTMNLKPYWHKLTQDQIDYLVKKNVTNQQIIDNYLQPDWCGEPDALHYVWGCWTLIDIKGNGRTKICKEYCKHCDSFIKNI